MENESYSWLYEVYQGSSLVTLEHYDERRIWSLETLLKEFTENKHKHLNDEK